MRLRTTKNVWPLLLVITKRGKSRDKPKRTQKGYLSKLIKEKNVEYSVTANIPGRTIRSRIKSINLDPKHPGTESPLYAAELAIFSVCIQITKRHAPLTGPRVTAFFKNMMKGTPSQDTLEQFQEKRAPNLDQHGTAGLGLWRGFKQRHADRIVTRKGRKSASIRSK